MKLELVRFEYGDTYTVGRLFVDGVYECFILEDVVRSSVKVYGKTAIPAGHYSVTIDNSIHFGKDMLHILNVPGFEGIRIHSGNTSKDTEGCLLVGKDWLKGDYVSNSRIAYNKLYPKIEAALKNKESVLIEIK